MTNELEIFLNNLLNLKNVLNDEEIKEFYNIINEYFKNRSKEETFEKNIKDLVKIYKEFNLTDKEIINSIKNNPSLIHADKRDLVFKFYMLGKVRDSKNGESLRKTIIVDKSKNLRTSYEVMYARIKHLESLRNNNEVIRNDYITIRKLLKITNEEFETSYGISKEELLKRYPFTNDSIREIQTWDENKEMFEEGLNARRK